MPKKAVLIFFLLAFAGAALFVYFTFPRTKDEIPTSNNQRPIPIEPPGPNTPNTPNGVPVPENVPHPNVPKPPPGPSLHVMAWATPAEARRLSADTDSFVALTGRQVSLTIAPDPLSYRHDLRQALDSGSPPDLCLISSRDFSGLNPEQDLADAKPVDGTPVRAVAAFTSGGKVKAVPDEFAVDVLFYNPAHFDEAGIAYPGTHWTWDILEADTRAIVSQQIKDAKGQPTFALELPANFDMWNILCAEAGTPALDLNAWHLADRSAAASQMRALQLIHELFQEYAITPPAGKNVPTPGQFFALQRASLLIARSDLTATLHGFQYGMTVLPRDIAPASLADVNGWAIPARSTQGDAALDLAQYLTDRPVHAGWTPIPAPANPNDDSSPSAVCHLALTAALVPRFDLTTAPMAQFLDQQISQLAHNTQETPQTLFARIQAKIAAPSAPAAIRGDLPYTSNTSLAPKADASSQLRGL